MTTPDRFDERFTRWYIRRLRTVYHVEPEQRAVEPYSSMEMMAYDAACWARRSVIADIRAAPRPGSR